MLATSVQFPSPSLSTHTHTHILRISCPLLLSIFVATLSRRPHAPTPPNSLCNARLEAYPPRCRPGSIATASTVSGAVERPSPRCGARWRVMYLGSGLLARGSLFPVQRTPRSRCGASADRQRGFVRMRSLVYGAALRAAEPAASDTWLWVRPTQPGLSQVGTTARPACKKKGVVLKYRNGSHPIYLSIICSS